MDNDPKARRRRLALDWLVALDIGALTAAFTLAALKRVDVETAKVLLWPKAQASRFIGAAMGWDEHIRQHDVIGLWLQMAVVAVAAAAVVFFALRQRHLSASADGHVLLFPAIVAVLVPWLFWAVAEGVDSIRPREPMHFVLLAILLAAIALGLRASAWVYRGEWKQRKALIVMCMVGSFALWWVLVDREMTGYSAPPAYAAATISVLLLVTWGRSVRNQVVQPELGPQP